MYGDPISLNYKKYPYFRSSVGGVITVLSVCSIALFLLMQFTDIWNYAYYIKLNQFYRDFRHDDTFYYLNLNVTDFGFMLHYHVTNNHSKYVEVMENFD
jgi:hypothetical protein